MGGELGKVGQDWLLLVLGCYLLFIDCWLIGRVELGKVGQSWARLVFVGSWLLVDWTCGGGKVGKVSC